MFVGRNFWKSSLLESEKFEISLSSSNAVISLIDLMARFCAFPFRCFRAFWIVWKRSSRLCIWLFSCSRRASMLAGSSLDNSAERALGTRNPCHQQYTSNSHLFSYKVDHGGSASSAIMDSIVVVSVLSFVSLPTMMCLTLPRLSYVYIGILTKSLFFPTHFHPYWFVYVCSCWFVGTCDNAFVEVGPNLFRIVRFDVEALRLIA